MKTIGYIAKSCMADTDMESMATYQRYVKYAIDEFRSLRLSGLMTVTNKTVKLEIGENNIAYLPEDYVSYIKVGINCGGRILNLEYNDNLLGAIMDANTDCGCDSLSSAQDKMCSGGNVSNWNTWWYNYPFLLDGQWYGGYYGYSAANYRGGFKIEGNVILFDSWVKSREVIIEYESNGIVGDSTLVPEGAIPVLEAAVHYKAQKFNPNLTTRLALQPFYNDYRVALTAYRARQVAMTATDWRQAYLRNMTQAIKR